MINDEIDFRKLNQFKNRIIEIGNNDNSINEECLMPMN